MSCRYLDRCIGDLNQCPFLKHGKSVRSCGFFGILKAKEEAEEHYTDEDRVLMEQLIERFASSWREAVRKGIRAPGRLTGRVFEEWVFEELRRVVGDRLAMEKEILLKFGKWKSDIVYSDGSHKVAIEVKMYFDAQHSLMAKGLLDYSSYKWIFISFHEVKKEARGILKLISKEYRNRFLYVCIVKHPSKALQEVIDFIKNV